MASNTQGETVTVEGVPTTSDGGYGLNGFFAAQGSWANAQGLTKSEREHYSNVANFFQHQGDLLWQEQQTDKEWSRNSPAAQLQQLMALGMTRQAALAVIQGGTATSNSASAGAPAAANASPLEDVTQFLSTATSSISGAVSLYQSCKMFGINFQTAQASLKAAQLGADYQRQINEGVALSGSLYGAFDKAKGLLGDDYDEATATQSVDTMISTISKAAEVSDDSDLNSFISDVLPLWQKSAMARSYTAATYQSHMSTKGWNPVEKDQSMIAAKAYAESEQEQQKVEELRQSVEYLKKQQDVADSQKRNIDASTAYIEGAQTDLARAQAGEARAAADLSRSQKSALDCDVEVKQATLNDVKAAAVAQAHIDAETLKGINNQKYYDAQVSKMLDDVESAKYWSAMAKLHASDADSYWNSAEGLATRQLNAFFYDPMFSQALDNIIKQGEVESQTVSEGLDLGIIKLQIQRKANRAAFLKETLYPSQKAEKAWNQNYIDATNTAVAP